MVKNNNVEDGKQSVDENFVEEKIKEIAYILNRSPEIRGFIREEDRNFVMDSFKIIEKDLKDAVNDIMVDEFDEDFIGKLDRFFSKHLQRIILEPTNRKIKVFFKKYSDLVMNWNKLAKRKRLDDSITSVKVFLEYQDHTSASIEVMKDLLMEAKKYRNFAPPAFELSKHFLRSIDDSLE